MTVYDTAQLVRFDPDRFTTRRVFESPDGLVVWFGFQPGQALREHQTSSRAWIQVLKGKVAVEVDQDRVTLEAGQNVVLAPEVPHSVTALEQSILQVVLFPHPHRHTLLDVES
ncbi:MAG: cupin domain-containing protein [Firmicutes bacterium]|nr:cupin domain-containing protein [Bacillota bacterium]